MTHSTLIEDIQTRPESSEQAPVLMVFSDDWGRHPSSCQHLISQLLSQYRVIWVNTIGMRPPRLNWSTVTRGFEKIKGWSSQEREPEETLPSNLNVIQPVMWPWMKRGYDRSFNQRLLVRQIKKVLSSIETPVIAITTIPIVADLMESLPVERWVYYCVDDFSVWPGLEQRALGAMEREVIERADVLIAAGTHLRDRLSQFRDDVQVVKHGLDLAHWTSSSESKSSGTWSETEQPRITFWGLIDRRMDITFIEQLSDRLPEGSINLVGPQDNPDPKLLTFKNVHLHSPVSYAELPLLATETDLLMMPYEDAPVTRAMQPLKLLEYLATGLPVVARDLPANREWNDCLDLAATAESFCDRVLHRLQTGIPQTQQSARVRLKNESWECKAQDFERLIVTGQS